MNELPRNRFDFSPGQRIWVTCRNGRTGWAKLETFGARPCTYSAPATLKAAALTIRGVVLAINGEVHFVANGDSPNRNLTEGWMPL